MEVFLGSLTLAGFNYAPKGWALCNGQLLPVNQNQALFSLLGTTFGGNGTSTFALPNLQGCVVAGSGTDSGSTYTLGQVLGSDTVTLAANQLPAHTHTLTVSSAAQATAAIVNGNTVGANTASNGFSATGGSAMAPASLSTVGGSQPHENRSPFLVANWIIALQGIYPSRN